MATGRLLRLAFATRKDRIHEGYLRPAKADARDRRAGGRAERQLPAPGEL
jgi:hypothetical protein